ncbi:MAG: cation:proton antiporter [Pseudomonadota bacterium]|nr:cation:proton antiporter [Pseudomonadota bacterium]
MPPPSPAILVDLAIIFGVAAATVAAFGRVGLPSVVGLLVAGAVLGPLGLAIVPEAHRIQGLAEIGVMVLLFIIGTELSIARLRRMGRALLLGGGLQVGVTVLVTVCVLSLRDVPLRQALFWGYLAALSSTAIVLRALDERGEVDAQHGRLVLGMLLFQDLCVVPMMMSLPMLAAEEVQTGALLLVLVRAVAVLLAALLLARRAVPWLLGHFAASQRREVFLLAVVALSLLVALLTAQLGLSLALGGFLAGVILADTPYVYQVQSELVPFRDAFASLFFVSIGMLLDPTLISEAPGEVLGWFGALLVGKLVIASLVGLLLRFPARVALRAGFAVAQVGEFSFALLQAGQRAGLAEPQEASRFLAASVLTMLVTPLLLVVGTRVAESHALTGLLDRVFGARGDRDSRAEPLRDHIIVAGLGLGGRTLLRALEAAGLPHVALDIDPERVRQERHEGRNVRFGDASNIEVLARAAHAERASTLVLLLSDVDAIRRAAVLAKRRWPELRVLARVHRAGPVDADLAAHGVEVVSEEWETVLEVVERVVRRRGRGPGEERRGWPEGHFPESSSPERRCPTAEMGAMPDVALDPVVVRAGDRLAGTTIAASRLREHSEAAIVALSRGARVHTEPPGETRVEPGDVVLLLGTHAEVARARGWIRREEGADP